MSDDEKHCTCTCRGCQHFHLDHAPAEGHDGHHTRLLLALDRSSAAACRSRGIPACNGIGDDSAGDCEIGSLHTRTAELVLSLARAFEEPQAIEIAAVSSLMAFLEDLARVVGGKPRVS